MLAICEGDLAPNTTATFQVTSCLRVTKTGVFSKTVWQRRLADPCPLAQFNVTALFDQDVRNDSSELGLASLGFTEDLVHVLNQIPAAFMAVSALFITGSVLVGASLAGSVCAVFAVQRARAAVLANLILAWLAWLVLLLATAISQATASTITRKVNELDDDVGLSAASGTKFSALTWAAVSLTLVAALSWSWTFAQPPKQLDDPSFDFAGRMRLPSRSMSTMNGLVGQDELVETTLLGRRRTLTFTMVQPPPAYLTGASEKDRV